MKARFRAREISRSAKTQWAIRMAGRKGVREVREAWVETAVGTAPPLDKWMVAYRLVNQEGEPVVAEVRLFPNERARDRPPGRWSAEYRGVDATVPPGGVPADLVRQVRVTEYRPFAREMIKWAKRQCGAAIVRGKGNDLDDLKPREERGRPDSFYAKIAQEYVDLLYSGTPSPVTQIAKNRAIPKGKVRDMVREARRRGLLTATQRGKMLGQLTPRAVQLLDGDAADTLARTGSPRKIGRP